MQNMVRSTVPFCMAYVRRLAQCLAQGWLRGVRKLSKPSVESPRHWSCLAK